MRGRLPLPPISPACGREKIGDSTAHFRFCCTHAARTSKMDWADRYVTPLSTVFSRQHKLELEWRVELALLKALGEAGLAPAEA
jgi:hypothetical protein